MRDSAESHSDRVLGALLRGGRPPSIRADELDLLIGAWDREHLAAYAHAGLSAWPPPRPEPVRCLLDRLFPLRRAAAHRAVLLTERLEQALDLLARAGVPVMPLKGTELAHRLYAAPELRFMADLDLWVPADAAGDALAALGGAGWRDVHPDPAVHAFWTARGYHLPLLCPDGQFHLELHHHLHPEIPARAQQGIWDRATPGRLLGRPVRLPQAADRLVYLSSHLATAGLRGAGRWLLDLALLVRCDAGTMRPEIAQVVERARECDQALYVVVASRALRLRWRIAEMAPVEAALTPELRPAERRVLRFIGRHGLRATRDRLLMARRLAGRDVSRPRRWLDNLWCHPGVVCFDLGVRSTDRLFPLHRLRHLTRRLRRAIAGVI